MEFLKVLLNLIYPEENICFICDEYYEGIENYLCNECRSKLQYIDYRVEEDVICALKYQGKAKDMIVKYKYGKNPYLYKLFGPIIFEAYQYYPIEDIDMIVPIPLSKKKKAIRGFNQSELLGKFISDKLDIPIDTQNLIKSKKTKSQSGLSKRDRRKNLKGAFSIKDDRVFKDKNILVVDDIFTSGATYNEVSKTLLNSGCKNTYLITIASGRTL